MGRTVIYLIAILMSWNTWFHVHSFAQASRDWRRVRRHLLADAREARRLFCLEPPPGLALSWREAGQWTSVCHSDQETPRLARYWRLEMRPNYGMLFLGQVPIRMSIVILI
jgi:hypothetical protein